MGGTSVQQGGTTGPGCTSGRNNVEEPGRRPGLQPGRDRPKGRAAHPRSEGKATPTPPCDTRGVSVETSGLWTKDRHLKGRNADRRSGGAKGAVEPGHGRRDCGGQDGPIIATLADQRPVLCKVNPAKSGNWASA